MKIVHSMLPKYAHGQNGQLRGDIVGSMNSEMTWGYKACFRKKAAPWQFENPWAMVGQGHGWPSTRRPTWGSECMRHPMVLRENEEVHTHFRQWEGGVVVQGPLRGHHLTALRGRNQVQSPPS